MFIILRPGIALGHVSGKTGILGHILVGVREFESHSSHSSLGSFPNSVAPSIRYYV